MQVFAPQLSTAARDYNLWGFSRLLKRNMERHSEDFGDALQLLDCDILPATTDSIYVLLTDTHAGRQFCFTHVFFNIAFFKSIFVSLFILILLEL